MCGVNTETTGVCRDATPDQYNNICWTQTETILLNCGMEKTDEDITDIKTIYSSAVKTDDVPTRIESFLKWLLTKTVKPAQDQNTNQHQEYIKCLLNRLKHNLNNNDVNARRKRIEEMVPELMDLLKLLGPKRTIKFSKAT